jgi:predicted DNA-binding protein YlxM (UPF0122 family)
MGAGTAVAAAKEIKRQILIQQIAQAERDLENYRKMVALLRERVFTLKQELEKMEKPA